ncbi:nuclease [Cytobacillus horneckiae]|uniref:Nuclease n=1 Tax=Cytobacillus horneckiae TaxID=549687 RepID=A0A2N0ZBS1_9BACI|nr:nuclease [Cytobacillus horneckiae]
MDEEVEKENEVKSEQKDVEQKVKAEAEKKAKEEQAKKDAAKKVEEEKIAKANDLGLIEATVSRIVDGDTIELSDGSKVRLVGVNTPESTNRTEEYGKEASNYTSSILEGKKVWLQKDVSDSDRYNRLLRIVWLDIPSDDMNENEIRAKMFNADFVINGFAEPSTYPPDVKYSDYFVKFAKVAREQNTGLWAFGENGTTKGDLDPKETKKTASSSNTSNSSNNNNNSASNNNNSNSTSTTTTEPDKTEYFQNCTELTKVYPNGVASDHPAYQPKMDRDKDNWACER